MDAIYEILGIPFGYVLRFIFEAVDNYGLALILFTLFARLLMIPTSIYQTKGTVKTQRLQPKIRRINAKYKGDQKKIQEETQALYQREGHNPMNMGCLPLAIQFIIIFGLIGVIYHPLKWALAIDETTINSLTEIAKTLPGYNAKTDLRTIELFVINHIDTIRPLALSKGIGAGVIDKRTRNPLGRPNSLGSYFSRNEPLLNAPAAQEQPRNGQEPDHGLHDFRYAPVLDLFHLPVPRRYRYLLDRVERFRAHSDSYPFVHPQPEEDDRKGYGR